MSKHIARLVVTVLILGILGYVGYTYFFNTDLNSHVYAQTLELSNNLLGDNSIESTFKNLKQKNYYGSTLKEDKSNVIKNEGNQKETYELRKVLFAFEEVEVGLSGGAISNNSGLLSLINELNNATLYYLTHAQFAQNVSSSSVKEFDAALKSLKNSLNEINNDINNSQSGLLRRQENSSMTDTSISQINNVYKSLLNKTVAHVKLQAEFLKELKDFVVIKSYNNNFIYETSGILYNSLIYTTLNFDNSFEGDKTLQTLYETMIIVKSSEDYKKSLGLSEFESDADLVRYYNDMVMGNENLLFGVGESNIFAFSYDDKVELANAGNIKNKVPTEYENNVRYILKWLGY